MTKLFSIFFILVFASVTFAQSDGWMRVQSDNGEFSIEIPSEYNFFSDQQGFSVSDRGEDYFLNEMNMLNAYHEKTLLSFETYKTSKKAFGILRENESRGGKSSEIKVGGNEIKQIVLQTRDSYTIKRFFNSKNYAYVLTVSSRNGETPIMKRFLDSLVFKPNSKSQESSGILFSRLKSTPIEFGSSQSQSVRANPTDEITKLAIVVKPNPSFTDSARRSSTQGNIRLRIAFSKNGWISAVSPLQTLPEGLLRQATFAAIRIKFLPQENNNVPVTVTKLLEYGFALY